MRTKPIEMNYQEVIEEIKARNNNAIEKLSNSDKDYIDTMDKAINPKFKYFPLWQLQQIIRGYQGKDKKINRITEGWFVNHK